MAQVFTSGGQLLGWFRQSVDPDFGYVDIPKRSKGDKGVIKKENENVVHRCSVKMYLYDDCGEIKTVGPFLVSDYIPDWFWECPNVVRFEGWSSKSD